MATHDDKKLIAPFALRFTRQVIWSEFEDRHTLEETIKQIKARETEGSTRVMYDVILDAPFPDIEITRTRQKDHENPSEQERDQWFALDNRRLYSLQRKALELWPRKVAIRAVLCQSTGACSRSDSMTAGRAALLHEPPLTGPSVNHLIRSSDKFYRWEWVKLVHCINTSQELAEAALWSVASDSVLQEGSALLNAVEDMAGPPGLSPPTPSWAAARHAKEKDPVEEEKEDLPDLPELPLHGGFVAPPLSTPLLPTGAVQELSATELCTAAASAAAASAAATTVITPPAAAKEAPPAAKAAVNDPPSEVAVEDLLSGTYHGTAGDSYEIACQGELSWSCMRVDKYMVRKAFTMWYDKENDAVWWGTNWKMYLSLAEVRKDGAKSGLKWRDVADQGSGHPRYVWQRSSDSDAEKENENKPDGRGKQQRGQVDGSGYHKSHSRDDDQNYNTSATDWNASRNYWKTGEQAWAGKGYSSWEKSTPGYTNKGNWSARSKGRSSYADGATAHEGQATGRGARTWTPKNAEDSADTAKKSWTPTANR